MLMSKTKYQTITTECEICGKEFRRSAQVDNPARFCSQDCLNKSRVGVKYEKYKVEDHWLEPIRKMYANGVGKGEVAKMAKRIGVPRTKINAIAREHGWLTRQTGKGYRYYWTEKELGIVERNGHLAPKAVQNRLKASGFKRTISAIEIKRSQLRAVQNRKGMSANGLAECMGVDVKTIINAIKAGKLSAKRRPGYEGEKPEYFIRSKNVRDYIQDWLPEINITYCDKYWLVDVLTGRGA